MEKSKNRNKHNYKRRTPTLLSPTPLATRPRKPNSEHRLENAMLQNPLQDNNKKNTLIASKFSTSFKTKKYAKVLRYAYKRPTSTIVNIKHVWLSTYCVRI